MNINNAHRLTILDPRVQPEPNTGCWLWVGKIDKDGYGHSGDRPAGRAHRVFYEALRGPIPRGLFIDHLCRVRSCVNPDHLRIATPRENTLAAGSEARPALNATKASCSKCGGPFTVRSCGRRGCAPCTRRLQRAWSAGLTREKKDALNRARREKRAAFAASHGEG